MKQSLIIASLIVAAAFAANAQTAASVSQSNIAMEIAACESTAGAYNPDEKKACIQVAVEKAVKACEDIASSPAMKVERDACIQVVREDAAK